MLRRRFLAGSLYAAVSSRLQAASPKHTFPREARDRLAVSTYPFRSLMRGGDPNAPGKAGTTLEQFAASLPAKFQVRGIEPWSHHFETTEPQYLRQLHQAFQKAGVHVVNIPVDIRLHLCESDPQQQAAGLDQYHKWVDAAALLDSPSIRVHVPSQSDGKTDIQCAIDTLSSLVRYAATKNIVVNLENDNPRTEDPFSIMDLIKAVSNPWLHTLPDFCNTMLISNDRSYNSRGLQAMFPYAYNISHVKDSEIDKGTVYKVDVAEIFKIAKEAHYIGYFSMEFEGSGDPYQGTAALIRQSLQGLA